MAGGNGKRGGGERVLESRHLVGLFLGVVLLCGVFFTLGYVMGRTAIGHAYATSCVGGFEPVSDCAFRRQREGRESRRRRKKRE